MIHICPVVMAGGSGTRLWPLSRSAYPKQFLALDGSASLLQQSVRRLMSLGGPGVSAPLVVGNEEHRFLLVDQLREIGHEPAALLLEPVGRNTAPALTLAALQAQQNGGDPVLVVAPADQTVTDEPAFASALREACAAAHEGAVVILGIPPVRPETGFGYIEAGARVAGSAHAVTRFVEKPDAPTAQRYVEAGNFFWNSGLFVLRASVWLKALERLRPDILQATRAAFGQARSDGVFGDLEVTAP